VDCLSELTCFELCHKCILLPLHSFSRIHENRGLSSNSHLPLRLGSRNVNNKSAIVFFLLLLILLTKAGIHGEYRFSPDSGDTGNIPEGLGGYLPNTTSRFFLMTYSKESRNSQDSSMHFSSEGLRHEKIVCYLFCTTAHKLSLKKKLLISFL
jgi:hypothetical protein